MLPDVMQGGDKIAALRSRFEHTWRKIAGGDPREVWPRLDAGYADLARAYHNWTHVAAMLDGLNSVRTLEEFAEADFEAVELAIWFHDAIYDARAKDNEERSARLLLDCVEASHPASLTPTPYPSPQGRGGLSGAGPASEPDDGAEPEFPSPLRGGARGGGDLRKADHIADMIRATATHAPSPDPSTRLLLDLDLRILGAPADIYDRYAEAVRQEYAFVPEALWRPGRAAVLRTFLERPAIYQTRHFARLYEHVARANIAREIAALDAG